MNIPSVLGMSFVDANFSLTWAGLYIKTPTLVLQGSSGSTPMLTADSTLITADGLDRVDADPTQLTAPYVLSQSPPPGTSYTPGTLQYVTINALGYPVPTPSGPIPVP